MQLDPIKPTLKAPGTMRLKLERGKLLSSIAFKFKLHRYSMGVLQTKLDACNAWELDRHVVRRRRLTRVDHAWFQHDLFILHCSLSPKALTR